MLCLRLACPRKRARSVASKKPVWEKPNPKKKSTPLSPGQKAKAKTAAKKAGRKYPNLVDNMRVARGR